MTTYNTGNPVPSADARDRYDNSQTFDEVINGGLTYYANRVGNNVLSFKGMSDLFNAQQQGFQSQFNSFLQNSGYETPVDYAPGLSVTRPTQTVRYLGDLYRPLYSALPFVTTTFAADESKWVANGDNSLRQELARATIQALSVGAVGDGVTNDFSAIRAGIIAANGKTFVFDDAVSYRIDGPGSLMVFGPDDLPDGVTIDFRGQKINWTGTRLTDGSQGDQFATNWGVFTFRGTEGASFSVTTSGALSAPMPFLPAPVSHTLQVGDCVLIQTLAPGVSEGAAEFKDRVINRTAQLSRISGGNLYFDNRFWFGLPSGTKITYTQLSPMRNIHLLNVEYTDASAYDIVNKNNGASFVVLEACEDSTALGINATGVPEHVVSVVRSRAIKASGYANDPKETVQGGYFTQIVQSSRIHFEDARGRNERHIVDITASAYVSVERSGSFATNNATFTTHGAYEHDLSYNNCYGYMSFSNSGVIFGSSTRRVTVDNQDGTNLNFGQFAHQGLSDATFRNCTFPSESYISLDGVQFENCEFGTVRLAQNSSRSKLPNVFANTSLTLHPEALNAATVGVAVPVSTAKVKLDNCATTFVTPPTISGGRPEFSGGQLNWSGSPTVTVPIRFTNGATVVNGTTSGAVSLSVQSDITVDDSELRGFGLRFDGIGVQRADLVNARIGFPTPGVTGSALEVTKSAGSLKLSAVGGSYDRGTPASRILTAITSGAILQMTFNGATLINGDVRVEPGLFTAGKNAFVYTGITEDAVTKTAFPAAGAHVAITSVIAV